MGTPLSSGTSKIGEPEPSLLWHHRHRQQKKGADRSRHPFFILQVTVWGFSFRCYYALPTSKFLGAYADLAKNWLKVADEIQAVNAAKPSPYRQKEEAPYSARTGASKNGGSAA